MEKSYAEETAPEASEAAEVAAQGTLLDPVISCEPDSMINQGGSYDTNASMQDELVSSIEVVESAQIGEGGLSAAARKRMKKKEKERAKKVAAATSNGASSSSSKKEKDGRRVPAQIRQIQENLAREKEEEKLREIEEAKAREEEERRHREEEKERQRREEEEELRREEKRKKKEEVKKKTKEKLLKKKQEDAQRRLGVMPEQLLDKCTVSLSNGTTEHCQADTNEGSNCETRADILRETEMLLLSPICCILGHVDAGKTKLLDCIRCSNIQEGEAGGITQQIGATYFPIENIKARTIVLKADATIKVPGLLVIDTPGHEAFANLRSRGSSLCDVAVLVVDIMHGLEPQTLESLNLLRSRNVDFIVALNKVDRLYGWKKCPNAPIFNALRQQPDFVKTEFNTRVSQIITQFMEQGVNTALYYKNKSLSDTFSIVPTSAISGEGIPDLLLLLVQRAHKTMQERLTYTDQVQCTVLEVKVIEGLGTTIDVVLVNGILHEGDQIVVCGLQGPIVTNIRALLTPHPMKELRVKGSYQHHKEIKAAQGVKISAQGLEHTIAGTALCVVRNSDDIEALKEAIMHDMNDIKDRINKTGVGVFVQASTLGSLEALTEFLKSPEVYIPVCDFSIGPVHKKDVMKASIMLDKKQEYATILAFDVKVMQDARQMADELGIKIFEADVIYHLFDKFKGYVTALREERKKESEKEAVFPCELKIMPRCVFYKKDPIVLGVQVLKGIAKVGTPICIPSRDFMEIGRIESIEINHKQVEIAGKGKAVSVKIVGRNAEEHQKMYGRHFDSTDKLVSHISRASIDALKANYRNDLSKEEWNLVRELKDVFKIV
ncbi:Eukaryotic translation initiation factor 5B [Rhynchospora pubera]|uniref:Eukaryotic translation initiation factor 5B n=1 Tax=Rhynchospora pubera TaxID=906938 RepID=A0AAV8FIS1_9POAL|nr:Eukaryotic translation initiation factor 5B [Rhynchospora pubera]